MYFCEVEALKHGGEQAWSRSPCDGVDSIVTELGEIVSRSRNHRSADLSVKAGILM